MGVEGVLRGAELATPKHAFWGTNNFNPVIFKKQKIQFEKK